MITCTRVLEFDAAHRVMYHESKCRTLHGHRYKVEVTAEAKNGLDNVGRVIDFSVLKTRLGGWLDQWWDHTTILYKFDPLIDPLENDPEAFKKPFIVDFNPTAENMAKFLLDLCNGPLFVDCDLSVVSIKIYETPNCKAEATL